MTDSGKERHLPFDWGHGRTLLCFFHQRIRRKFNTLDVRSTVGNIRIEMRPNAALDAESDIILRTTNLNKKYGDSFALEGISIEVHRGSHVLVIGPNGAGKSTLIKCIMDLINFQGQIQVNGTDVHQEPEKAKALIGYVPQNHAFYENLSVYEHAQLTCKLKATTREEAKDKLQSVDLWDLRSRKVKTLSIGMKQRLAIAVALIGDPPLMLLDEPTSNVDMRGQLDFQELLKRIVEQGKTILTTTHLSGLGELASEVIILDKGKIIARGSPSDLLSGMKITNTLYVRVTNEGTNDVLDFFQKRGATDAKRKGDWIAVSFAGDSKIDFLRGLLDSGLPVTDIIIERGSIESEYLKLLRGEG